VVPVRLVASDIDGTLLRSDDTVSQRTKTAVQALTDAGHTFALATGRPLRWVGPIADLLGHQGLAVAANGALVIDMRTGEILHETLLHPHVSLQIVDALLDKVPGVSFAVDGLDRFGHDLRYKPRWPVPAPVIAPIHELIGEPFVKLLVRADPMNGDRLLELCAQAIGENGRATRSTADALIEITAPGTGKESALAWIAAQRGIAQADCVAFGDMLNDLGMLAWAGLGVAMANSHSHVLNIADEITASNDDDGVAIVIERLLRSH
jgi:Cof subfamily protein (haloacid dehalogenase superfamily)